ncbi:UNVERIFIED_CONTAM: hypothetical protein Sradi_1141900 [Sesamum radiatum]|uniref:Glycosyl transferase family 1 domain-containing protein n=1 Tax=Sesamum radiatum TaxID=300843 RepID=A0AAW2VEH7_SESRA
MGSLESRSPFKKDHHLQGSSSLRNTTTSSSSSSSNVSGFWGQRNRSRFARLVFFRKINYLQLICAVAVFFFFVFLIQMSLPGSVLDDVRKNDKTHHLFRKNGEGNFTDLSFFKELDFGEDVNFEPSKILAKFQKDAKEVNQSVGSREVIRFGYRKPKLALVFADLWVDPHQILMVTVATALREIGYEIEVFSLEDGPVHAIWREVGLPLSVITADENMKFSVDWLNYNGILVNSLKAVGFLSSLMQEPFRNVPVIWTIHEQTLASRLREYVSSGQTDLVDNWRKVFSRATVIVFRNYILPALHPVLRDFSSSSSHLKIIILAGHSTSNYSSAVETIARTLKYPNEAIKHVAVDDANTVLSTADLVIYGSFLEEHAFPETLLKAMCFGKPIIAPDLPMIRKYVGYWGSDTNHVSTGLKWKTLSSAQDAASSGKHAAKNLMVSESVEGYALLLENILALPSEVSISQAAKQIPVELKAEWQWHHFEAIKDAHSPNETRRMYKFLNKLKDRTDHPRGIWDEVYRSARRTDRILHERDEGELERTGQPLCIYEPYFGEGTWPFLHRTSLYRGIGLKSLSKTAERSLLGAIEARRHGDALYFWAGLHMDMRNHLEQDFWSFCDAINAGNCQMFVDALDAQFYDEHQKTGHCCLNLSKCTKNGVCGPRDRIHARTAQAEWSKGRMWVKWFQFSTLKSMDEDLAEELDSEHPKRRWLWPSTVKFSGKVSMKRRRN